MYAYVQSVSHTYNLLISEAKAKQNKQRNQNTNRVVPDLLRALQLFHISFLVL